MKLAIAGGFGGTHLGGSFARAAAELGLETLCFDSGEASWGPRLLRSLRWHLADRKPLRLGRFSASVVAACAEARPDVLIATGAAALTAPALIILRDLGVRTVNFSTDDPWNRNLGSRWHRRALPVYDAVFTPRRANIIDLETLGCRNVRYLPFGYDEALFAPPGDAGAPPDGDVLFVGGGDADRLAFIRAFMRSGPSVSLAGGYWDRFAATRDRAIGLKSPEALAALTAEAKVNLCLVRQANRDGHVMRSFEIAAIGGCMLVEDTVEHREIFGPDGECVRYFSGPEDAAGLANVLVSDPAERGRLASAVHARVIAGHHTYRDRLHALIEGTTASAAPGSSKLDAA